MEVRISTEAAEPVRETNSSNNQTGPGASNLHLEIAFYYKMVVVILGCAGNIATVLYFSTHRL